MGFQSYLIQCADDEDDVNFDDNDDDDDGITIYRAPFLNCSIGAFARIYKNKLSTIKN